ncbi:MAG: hypothetical protein L3J05_03725 [Robiginitomaculum sp.]|nr:hypothetical protein [Robiginitomaculum sp.]
MLLSYLFAAGLFIALVGLSFIFCIPALTLLSSRRLALFHGAVLALFVLGLAVLADVGALGGSVFTSLSTSFAFLVFLPGFA